MEAYDVRKERRRHQHHGQSRTPEQLPRGKLKGGLEKKAASGRIISSADNQVRKPWGRNPRAWEARITEHGMAGRRLS